MKRISGVVKKENFVPEQGYLVFTEKGLIVFNGRIGLLYSPERVGAKLMGAVQRHGRFAVPDAAKFLRTLSVLENVATVDIDKMRSSMMIKFLNGKGSLELPVVLNLSEKIPHMDIKWRDYEGDKSKGLAISQVWREVEQLVTTEGEALWGDVIGIYSHADRLTSFDYGVFLEGPKSPTPLAPFYCPLAMLELGINDVEYAISDESGVFLVGKDIQYVCTSVTKADTINDMARLKDSFEAGQQKKATLDFTSAVWKRAKVFANNILKLTVKDGDIVISHEGWHESIGKTEAPNAEFNTRISLLERWASGSLDHKIAIGADGGWYLHGTTRCGLAFYAVLTDISNPSKAAASSARDVVQPKADEIDLPSGSGPLL